MKRFDFTSDEGGAIVIFGIPFLGSLYRFITKPCVDSGTELLIAICIMAYFIYEYIRCNR